MVRYLIKKFRGIFYLNDSSVKDGFPFLPDDFKYYGKVVGYCLLEEDSGSQIPFRPFKNFRADSRQRTESGDSVQISRGAPGENGV
jgi:hypothetical protein